jgi:hypothetical protein
VGSENEVQGKGRGSSLFQLAPALIGLLGVLIGAAATSGVTYWLDHGHAKTGERGAERPVLNEILRDYALVKPAAVSRTVRRPPPRRAKLTMLTDAVWRTERERLDRSLSDREWAWVMKYYYDLATYDHDLAHRKSIRVRLHTDTQRLKADAPCALIALNVEKYFDVDHGKYFHDVAQSVDHEKSIDNERCEKRPEEP